MAADYRRSMDDQTTIFIDNEHVAAEASDRITVINPATEENHRFGSGLRAGRYRPGRRQFGGSVQR